MSAFHLFKTKDESTVLGKGRYQFDLAFQESRYYYYFRFEDNTRPIIEYDNKDNMYISCYGEDLFKQIKNESGDFFYVYSTLKNRESDLYYIKKYMIKIKKYIKFSKEFQYIDYDEIVFYP